MKLYILHTGDYSDYTFHGAFSKSDFAKEVGKRLGAEDPEIIETEVDTIYDGEYWLFHCVCNLVDGKNCIVNIAGSYDSENRIGYIFQRGYPRPHFAFAAFIKAKTKQDAAKILNEKRRKYASLTSEELQAIIEGGGEVLI